MYISANDLDFSDAQFAVSAWKRGRRVRGRGGAARQGVDVRGRPIAAVAYYGFTPRPSTLLRKALGASPVAFLKKRVKYAGSEKPIAYDNSLIDIDV